MRNALPDGMGADERMVRCESLRRRSTLPVSPEAILPERPRREDLIALAGELGVNLADIGRYYASPPNRFLVAAAITMLPPRADAGVAVAAG